MSCAKSAERRTPLSSDQQGLAAKYMPLARSLARPMKLAWPEAADDFESAACFALVEAAQTYDPNRNVKFPTFARFRIRGALRDVQRDLLHRLRKIDPAVAGIDPLPRGFDDGDRFHRPVDSGVGREVEVNDAVEHLLKKLPAKHAEVCRQIYLEGKSQNEAAQWLGCSKSRLCYLHKESLEMLNGTWQARVCAADEVAV